MSLHLVQSAAEAGPSEFMQTIDLAISAMQAERQKKIIAGGTVSGGLVEIQDVERLGIISDLHGDSRSLFGILEKINYEQFLASRRNKLVFLGDYVDRGSDSAGVLYSVCYLKQKYPDSVILMRGNHESPAEFPFSPHDLPYRLMERFSSDSKTIYSRLLTLFRLLTLATVVQHKLLLVHGGLPTDAEAIANFRESIATAQENHLRNRVLEELLWNDPRPVQSESGWEMSDRGIGRYFGSSISKKWLGASGTKVVVRGHEQCQGFKIDHDGMVLTLFSCMEAYPGFEAAYVLLDAKQLSAVKDARDLASYASKLDA